MAPPARARRRRRTPPARVSRAAAAAGARVVSATRREAASSRLPAATGAGSAPVSRTAAGRASARRLGPRAACVESASPARADAARTSTPPRSERGERRFGFVLVRVRNEVRDGARGARGGVPRGAPKAPRRSSPAETTPPTGRAPALRRAARGGESPRRRVDASRDTASRDAPLGEVRGRARGVARARAERSVTRRGGEVATEKSSEVACRAVRSVCTPPAREARAASPRRRPRAPRRPESPSREPRARPPPRNHRRRPEPGATSGAARPRTCDRRLRTPRERRRGVWTPRRTS